MKYLLIGGSGGIGQALVKQITQHDPESEIWLSYNQTKPTTQERNIHPFKLDLTDNRAISRQCQILMSQAQRFDYVFNLAAILHRTVNGELKRSPEKSLSQLEPEWLNKSLQINAVAPIEVVRQLLPSFDKNQPSKIINLSAMVGSLNDNQLGGWHSYRASKACLNMLSKNIAIELSRSKLGLIACYHPGTTDTQLSKPFQRNVDPDVLKTAEQAAQLLWQFAQQLDWDQHGGFFKWDGSRLDW